MTSDFTTEYYFMEVKETIDFNKPIQSAWTEYIEILLTLNPELSEEDFNRIKKVYFTGAMQGFCYGHRLLQSDGLVNKGEKYREFAKKAIDEFKEILKEGSYIL